MLRPGLRPSPATFLSIDYESYTVAGGGGTARKYIGRWNGGGQKLPILPILTRYEQPASVLFLQPRTRRPTDLVCNFCNALEQRWRDFVQQCLVRGLILGAAAIHRVALPGRADKARGHRV
jgi:hypothetical protein